MINFILWWNRWPLLLCKLRTLYSFHPFACIAIYSNILSDGQWASDVACFLTFSLFHKKIHLCCIMVSMNALFIWKKKKTRFTLCSSLDCFVVHFVISVTDFSRLHSSYAKWNERRLRGKFLNNIWILSQNSKTHVNLTDQKNANKFTFDIRFRDWQMRTQLIHAPNIYIYICMLAKSASKHKTIRMQSEYECQYSTYLSTTIFKYSVGNLSIRKWRRNRTIRICFDLKCVQSKLAKGITLILKKRNKNKGNIIINNLKKNSLVHEHTADL